VRQVCCSLLALIAVALGSLHAQHRIDSLKQALKDDMPDSTRIRILVEISSLNQYVNIKESWQSGEEAVALAEELDNPELLVIAYQQKAFLLTSNGNYSGALRYDNLTLEIDMMRRDSVLIARDFNNIGNDYYDLGEYDEAFNYFTQSHRVASQVHDTLKMLIAYHNVGRVFKELGQFDRALDHLKLAMKMSIQQGDDEGIAYAHDEIGDVQLRKNQLDSALHTLTLALSYARKYNVNVVEPKIHSKLAMVHLGRKDPYKAMSHYDSAYALHNLTNDQFGAAEVELGRGIVFTEERRYDEALEKVEGSLNIAKERNARVLEIKCFKQLSTLWELKGDSYKSLGFYKQYKHMEDSILSQEMQCKLLRYQLLFESESRD
jgi:tetratricopeptide (TPR) repeat protein